MLYVQLDILYWNTGTYCYKDTMRQSRTLECIKEKVFIGTKHVNSGVADNELLHYAASLMRFALTVSTAKSVMVKRAIGEL